MEEQQDAEVEEDQLLVDKIEKKEVKKDGSL